MAAAIAKALLMALVRGGTLTVCGRSTIGADERSVTVSYIGANRHGQSVVVGKV